MKTPRFKSSFETERIRSRLNQIRNWEERAERSHYSARELASGCKTSLRQVERFFLETKGVSPHQWLNQQRQQKALALLHAGCIVKEVSVLLGYKQAAHFSREFKRYHGVSPANVADTLVQGSPLKTNGYAPILVAAGRRHTSGADARPARLWH